MHTEFLNLPIAQLRVSSTPCQAERRKHLDKGAIGELAKSIAGVGILQPLVVRRVTFMPSDAQLPDEQRMFEIVAGERRYLAAKEAKLERVPVTVRELTDEQLLEVQLVENLQRDDVHPMAEAEGYESLRKLGRGVEEIADKVGKSRAYVYARMKLLDLCDKARKAYYAGKLNASTALYVARVPMAGGLQEKALKEVTEDSWQGPMSARDAQQHIQRNYMLRLSEAPFSTKDAELVTAAGACGPCPHRTGNQAELFGDVKGADVCTSPTCFHAKVEAHNARAIERAKASGQTVISGAAAKKVAPNGVHSMNGYVCLDDQNWDDPKRRTYRQILGKSYTPTLLMDERKGRLVEIAPEADLPKGTKKSSLSPSDNYKSQQKREQQKRLLEITVRRSLFRAIWDSPVENGTEMALMQAAVTGYFKALGADTQKSIAAALDWDVKGTKGAQDKYSQHVNPAPFIAKMGAPEIWKFLRALSIAGELAVWTYNTDRNTPLMDAAAQACGIDAKQIRADLVAAAKQKAKDKAKKAKASTGRTPASKSTIQPEAA